MQDYHSFLAEILIPEDQLKARVKELGEEISRDYEDKEIMAICILRGGVMFLTDLIRHIKPPVAIDFMGVSSYGVGSRSSDGQVRITLDLTTSIGGKHVLIVEDIIDSGNTLSSVIEMLRTRNPASLEVCTLLNKFSRREVDVPIKYCGFDIPDKFVFGYGLDMDEYYRNLPFIGVVDLDKYEAQV
ncbi:MAG: hypoxanthine phosphoribosyltransferase [Brevefilum sp.]|jgi:hypoxanthine phosphoribosyltransferase|nr:MAG: Hypoxanthine phosphoribosyltransferase [Anaerolineae bacterium 49_20]MDF1519677.1 hypoxanthine phosphoribosyltransferase [Brevefilum sp.]MDT8381242.1 hypoxanthine phosphoribosyltransferase [Brevefilum sp.]MDW7753823.1 hypoxanthine phosphoribosyltransferase [Brevefilum sp.]